MGENLVVESEVIAGDDIDTGLLLDVPVLETKSLGLSEEVCLGELSAPVGFSGLLEVAVNAHTGETEDGSVGMELASLKLSMGGVHREYIRLNHDCGLGYGIEG